MKPEYEWRDCVHCEVKYIEDCKHQDVDLNGKRKLPDYCFRKDLVRDEPNPHKQNERHETRKDDI